MWPFPTMHRDSNSNDLTRVEHRIKAELSMAQYRTDMRLAPPSDVLTAPTRDSDAVTTVGQKIQLWKRPKLIAGSKRRRRYAADARTKCK